MFSGLIEACTNIQKVEEFNDLIRIWVSRPSDFTDIKIGDSIAVNGVCLTVEAFDESAIQFALGHETIQVLKINPKNLLNQKVNLERSLRFGDRMHGHLVSGHVEALGTLTKKSWQGDCLVMRVSLPKEIRAAVWKKGSVALHGVSLTVNDTTENELEVCLIPETLKKTNLADLNEGTLINVETDYLAKALFERWKFWQKENPNGL
jgi:riboflavin synthase